jgi:voltage-gated potassium channel
VIYFSLITITTVGYGDIVPVSTAARLLDSFVVTPIRVFVWLLFLGTAYQLIIQRYQEGQRMAKVQAHLDQHLIVCGYGNTGRAAVKELLAKGMDPRQVVVIDFREDRAREAVEKKVISLQGDAAKKTVLKDVMLDRAKAVIIATGRDDTNVLITLTVRHLNPMVRIIVSAKEEENVTLFRQGGADVILSPSTFGGYALAAAVDQLYLVKYLEDLLTAGGRVNLIERPVLPEEIGKGPEFLKPNLLLRVHRGDKLLSLWDLQKGQMLERGDILVVLKPVVSEDRGRAEKTQGL